MNKVKPEKTKRVTKPQKIIFAIAIAIFLLGLIGSCVTGTTPLDGCWKESEIVEPHSYWIVEPHSHWGVNWSPAASNIS